MAKSLFLSIVGLMMITGTAFAQDIHHISSVPASGYVGVGLSTRDYSEVNARLEQVIDQCEASCREVCYTILDRIASVDFKAFLDRVLPTKFKEIMNQSMGWTEELPEELQPRLIDLKEMAELGKETYDKISSLRNDKDQIIGNP